jgi:hypothetical protein
MNLPTLFCIKTAPSALALLAGVVSIAFGLCLSSTVAIGQDSSVIMIEASRGNPSGLAGSPLDTSGTPPTNGPPVIVAQPVTQTVRFLQNATFQVVAGGALPLGFQWQHTGTNLPGATASVLVVSAIRPPNAGPYTVVVTNIFGAITSDPAILTVGGLIPDIVSRFSDTNVMCGDSVSFSVVATVPIPTSPSFRPRYQWQFEGNPINNATNTSLSLTNLTPAQTGQYTVNVSNFYGSTNVSAQLNVTPVPPVITSPLNVTATQGAPFSYSIQATHSPLGYNVQYLPQGLSIDPGTGLISGTPLESGTFGPVLWVTNLCTAGSAMLSLTVNSAAPVLQTPAPLTGTEGSPFAYQIRASGLNLAFAAQNLPPGLTLNGVSGRVSGTPLLAGDYDSPVTVSNLWGLAAATLHFAISNAPVAGLSIGNVSYSYSSPYLLDFSFSLLDDNDPTVGNGIVADPSLLSLTCFEDDVPISASETGAFVSRTSRKVIKANLVLDFTESIASLSNGDTNGNGISDAVDNLVNGAMAMVNQQSADTQIGVYEFHREDQDPSLVIGLTTDKARVDNAIAGIWTNFVRNFPAGSRCWDAAMAAIGGLGAANRDEEHFLILVSDGHDESSTNSLASVVTAASAANIQVFTVGFGAELDPVSLQTLASGTQGRYYAALTPADIAAQIAQISKMARGQYILRWASLKRSNSFMPSFQVTYQGLTANSPTNPFTLGSTNIDTTVDPPVTNITPASTNFIIGYFSTVSNAGPVLVGSLRIVPNADVQPTGLDLRATYIPRFIRQLRLHYRANWPCTATLQSTGPGELLTGWTLSQTNDGTGGNWLLLSSPNPADLSNSLPFAAFGKVLTFAFEDAIDPTNAFSLLQIDNTIYTNTGGQSFVFENTTNFLNNYPSLPHGTPILWLMSYGFSGDFTNAEAMDSDQDGVPNWQEFRANTNPTNASSVFAVRSVVQLPDGRYQVQFDTSTNRIYRVDASTDLMSWRTVQDSIIGLNQPVTITDTAYVPHTNNVFYRAAVY